MATRQSIICIVLATLKIALAISFFILMRGIIGAAWRSVCALLIALPGLGNIVTCHLYRGARDAVRFTALLPP